MEEKIGSDIIDLDDDFDLDELDGIVDETQKDDAVPTIKFNISSYGVDYTVDTLIKRVKTEAFFVPPFQRSFVWSKTHASEFIESLLLGLPVPGIFLYKEPSSSGKHLIIDGQQRLKTLHFFMNEQKFLGKPFKLQRVTAPWNGKTFDELDESDRLRLEDAIIHTTVFQQDEPKEGDQSVYYVFHRINSGGVRLSPQEIRSCVNYGEFTKLLDELNSYPSWRKIFGPKHKRMKDREMILRFISLFFESDKYKRPFGEFVNNFLEKNRNLDTAKQTEFRNLFTDTVDLFEKALGKSAFRPERALNAAVFDAVMVGLARRLSEGGETPSYSAVEEAYNKTLKSKKFLKAVERATADEENVRTRINEATTHFAAI